MSDFRPQAVKAYVDPDIRGGILLIAPPWVLLLHGAVVLFCAFGIALAIVGRVRVHAVGRGVVRPEDGVRSVETHLAGRVRSVHAREGGTIQAGDVLAVLDDPDLEGDVAENARILEVEERYLAALEERLGREPALPEQAARVEAQRQVVARAEIRREVLAARRDQRTLRATASGVVAALPVREGDYLQPGDLVGRIVPSDSALRGYLELPERHRAHLEPGTAVRLHLDAYPYQEMGAGEGRVVRVGEDLLPGEDGGEGRLLVEVDLDKMPPGARGGFQNGMVFTGEVVLRRKRILAVLFEPLEGILGE